MKSAWSRIRASREALSVNLLGMSVLSPVRWTHKRGKLVLEQ